MRVVSTLFIALMLITDGSVLAKRIGGSRYLANSTGATNASLTSHTIARENVTSFSSTTKPFNEAVVVEEEGESSKNTSEPNESQELTAAPAAPAGAMGEDQLNLEDFTTDPTQEPTAKEVLVTYYLDYFFGELFFNATTGANGTEGFNVLGEFLAAADKVFFVASTTEAAVEPWVTDGTPTGTRMVKDIYR